MNFYHTSMAANFTANFTNVPTSVTYRTFVFTLVLVQGATAYVPSAVQVNGTAMTISWLSNSAPSGNANKTELVSFTLLYTTSLASSKLLGQWATFG
jgi:hypothetical protein